MLFIKLSRQQVAAYSYACTKLQTILNKMSMTRKTLEKIAAASFNKPFARCVYLFASESLQFENEIHAQIDSFNCKELNGDIKDTDEKTNSVFLTKDMELICSYLEESYIKSYRQLLKDKYLSNSLKSLINNQLQAILSSLAQLRLFNEVKTLVN